MLFNMMLFFLDVVCSSTFLTVKDREVKSIWIEPNQPTTSVQVSTTQGLEYLVSVGFCPPYPLVLGDEWPQLYEIVCGVPPVSFTQIRVRLMGSIPCGQRSRATLLLDSVHIEHVTRQMLVSRYSYLVYWVIEYDEFIIIIIIYYNLLLYNISSNISIISSR